MLEKATKLANSPWMLSTPFAVFVTTTVAFRYCFFPHYILVQFQPLPLSKPVGWYLMRLQCLTISVYCGSTYPLFPGQLKPARWL
jgi:hypothetical protein